ncbi:unnamed protein product [Hanseniaspora opuntiae]
MMSNTRPKTPNLKDDVDMSDENVYNTLLKSWNNVVNTPKTKVTDNDIPNASPQHFVTPTKISNFNINHYHNENLDDHVNYQDMILNSTESSCFSEKNDTEDIKPLKNHKDDPKNFEMERSYSTNELSLNPKVELSAAHLNKSISTNDIKRVDSCPNNSSFMSTKTFNDNIVSKNKLSIYKQFKKFNWGEVTPTKSKKERKMSFESANTFNPLNSSKSLLERSNSITATNGLLATPLLNQESLNWPDSGSLSRPQVRSNGSQVFLESNETLFDNSPYDDENIFNSDALKKRSCNPRSSFSSSLDVFNMYNNDVLSINEDGTLKPNDDFVSIKFLEQQRKPSITSNFRDVNYNYLNNLEGINVTNTAKVKENNLSPSAVKNMTPPLLLKRMNKSYQNPAKSKPADKGKMILLEIPYTNDNFDQVLGIAKIVNDLQGNDYADIDWIVTMTYIVEAQEELLIKDMMNTMRIPCDDVKKVINDLRLQNDKQYLLKSSTGSILKKYPELKHLNFDHINSLKLKLLDKQATLYDIRSSTNSRYSSVTTIHDGGEVIKQPIIGDLSDDISTVYKRQDNYDNLSMTSHLNAPYLPVNGSNYIPKHLTLRLFDYKHFNEREDLEGYLSIMKRVFTNKEFFLNLWNNAKDLIDNDNSTYHEYNFKGKGEENGITAKVHFYKPSNEIQLVVDEYFTAYSKKNYDKFRKLSCSNEEEIKNNGGKERRGSYVDCYDILTKIYQGEKTTLYV